MIWRRPKKRVYRLSDTSTETWCSRLSHVAENLVGRDHAARDIPEASVDALLVLAWRWYTLITFFTRLSMTHTLTIDARETAILTRALQPKKHNLSPAAARALLRIQLDPADRQRLHELLVKNREDTLSADERDELDSHLHVGLLIDLLQAKARAALHTSTRRPVRKNG
jgi:hypothetical protein